MIGRWACFFALAAIAAASNVAVGGTRPLPAHWTETCQYKQSVYPYDLLDHFPTPPELQENQRRRIERRDEMLAHYSSEARTHNKNCEKQISSLNCVTMLWAASDKIGFFGLEKPKYVSYLRVYDSFSRRYVKIEDFLNEQIGFMEDRVCREMRNEWDPAHWQAGGKHHQGLTDLLDEREDMFQHKRETYGADMNVFVGSTCAAIPTMYRTIMGDLRKEDGLDKLLENLNAIQEVNIHKGLSLKQVKALRRTAATRFEKFVSACTTPAKFEHVDLLFCEALKVAPADPEADFLIPLCRKWTHDGQLQHVCARIAARPARGHAVRGKHIARGEQV